MRQALFFLLFETFKVEQVCCALALTLPLYLTGLNTGLVVDCGYTNTRVLAIFAGVPILSSYREIPLGGRTADEYLARALYAHLKQEPHRIPVG